MAAHFNRAGHLVAKHLNGKGKTILLIGHLDTVFEPNSPFQQFKMINDSTAASRAFDMKGGDVIMVTALQALNDAGLLRDMNIIIVMTGDEEHSGSPFELSKRFDWSRQTGWRCFRFWRWRWQNNNGRGVA